MVNKCQTLQAAAVMREWVNNDGVQVEVRQRGSSAPWVLCGNSISWNWGGSEYRIAPKPIKVTGWAVVEAMSGRIVHQGVVESYIKEWCANLNRSKDNECEYVVIEMTGTIPVCCQKG